MRRIGPNGNVQAVVGTPQVDGRVVADETSTANAVLTGPRGVVVAGGNLIVADTENHCIWYVDRERGRVRLMAESETCSSFAFK